MTIDLSDSELTVLRRALDTYLAEMRSEASRTEQADLKRSIWEEEKILERLRDRL